MSDFITLTCPTCGAKLKLADKINLLVCASCGNEHMVQRDGGAIYLDPIVQDVQQIRVGVDKTAAELAIVRLEKEILALEERSLVPEQRFIQVATAFNAEQKKIETERAVAVKKMADKKGVKSWFNTGCLAAVGLSFLIIIMLLFANGAYAWAIVILLAALFVFDLIWRDSREEAKKNQAILANPYQKEWETIGKEVKSYRDELVTKRRQLAQNRQIVES